MLSYTAFRPVCLHVYLAVCHIYVLQFICRYLLSVCMSVYMSVLSLFVFFHVTSVCMSSCLPGGCLSCLSFWHVCFPVLYVCIVVLYVVQSVMCIVMPACRIFLPVLYGFHICMYSCHVFLSASNVGQNTCYTATTKNISKCRTVQDQQQLVHWAAMCRIFNL